jgi:hypothetical protein
VTAAALSISTMAETKATPHRSRTMYWLAAILGVGLILGAAYLYVAEYTADEGGRCGSLASMSETVHYSPPNDGGCASAKDTRVVLFLGTGLAGLVLVIGGVGGALWATLKQSRRDHDGTSQPSAAGVH